MDQTTQQNAAMVEQSTAASNALAMEAAKLRDLVAQFRLDSAPAVQSAALRHAARAMAQPPAVSSPRAAMQAVPARKMAAGGGHAGSDWEEF
jgi:methyl-accepting chemotaxis protein